MSGNDAIRIFPVKSRPETESCQRQVSSAAGIHFCECDGIYIFLDIPADRYFRFSPEQSSWFRLILENPSSSRVPEKVSQFRDSLVQRGILIVIDGESPPRYVPIPPASYSSIFQPDTDLQGRLSAQIWIRAARAVLRSWWLVRHSSLEGIVNHVSGLKKKIHQGREREITGFEPLVAVFHRLTPYFFTSTDACKYRSLALIEFLGAYGFSADWVFGVRLAPFRAHCWVEIGSVILNDYVDNVREFKPILRI